MDLHLSVEKLRILCPLLSDKMSDIRDRQEWGRDLPDAAVSRNLTANWRCRPKPDPRRDGLNFRQPVIRRVQEYGRI
jgi:hypothetical protein